MTNPLVMAVVVDEKSVDVTVPPNSVDVTAEPGAPLAVVTVEGPPGPRGLPGNGTFITREAPTGIVDGVHDTFTLAHTFQPGSTSVFLNGLLEIFCNELEPNQIQFPAPPQDGDVIRVNYTVSS